MKPKTDLQSTGPQMPLPDEVGSRIFRAFGIEVFMISEFQGLGYRVSRSGFRSSRKGDPLKRPIPCGAAQTLHPFYLVLTAVSMGPGGGTWTLSVLVLRFCVLQFRVLGLGSRILGSGVRPKTPPPPPKKKKKNTKTSTLQSVHKPSVGRVRVPFP